MKKLVIILLLHCVYTIGVSQNTFPSSGNVGIGTANENADLEVHGKVNIDNENGLFGLNQLAGSFNSGSGIRELFRVSHASLSTNGSFSLSATRGNFVHSSQWAWSSNHNSTGRGTLTQLTSSDYSDIILYLDVDYSGNCIISADWGASQTYHITIQKMTGGALDLSNQDSDWSLPSTNYLRVKSVTTIKGSLQVEKLILNGSLGVGISAPMSPLHIVGGTPMSAGWNKTATLQATFPVLSFNSNNSKWAGIGYDFSSNFNIWVNGSSSDISGTATNALSIMQTGNIGVGTSSPVAKLTVANNSSNILALNINSPNTTGQSFGGRIYAGSNASDYALSIYNAGDTKNLFFVRGDGNIGIGTVNPTSKLSLESISSRIVSFKRPGSNEFGFEIGGSTFGLYNYTTNKYRWRTNGNDFLIDEDGLGKVGIGTTSPISKFHAKGNVEITSGHDIGQMTLGETTGTLFQFAGSQRGTDTTNQFQGGFGMLSGSSQISPIIWIYGFAERNAFQVRNKGYNSKVQDAPVLFHVGANHRVGVGTSNPTEKLHIVGNTRIDDGYALRFGDGFQYVTSIAANNQLSFGSNGGVNMAIVNGNVGIGTTTIPDGYKLAIEGKIITEKVVVRKNENWPDFVFAKDYKLPELKDVEVFLQENQHLPEIPTAKDIEKNGQDLAEMNRLLLKKVEELTLYVIDLNNRMVLIESSN